MRRVRQERIYTDKQAAEILGMSVQTLRNWRCERRGPKFCKFGRSVRYSAEALHEFIDQTEVKTQAI